ncbi:MAG: S49 family peptidase, partial [Deltaproteobacteria bacterium]|nr:S49 family peptidase [Deltaproteobacteria bacterium]
MTTWLLEPNTKEIITQGERGGLSFTAEQQAKHLEALSGVTPGIMSVAGDKADIAIRGVLTASPNIFAMFLGGGNTTYPDIIASIAAAEQDDAVSEIILSIDSPGGDISGLFDTLAAIRATTKPVKAVVLNTAASAAYAIAAQADEIVASNRATRVGSIGIAVSVHVSENRVDIASTNAPKKRPDVTTAE